MFYERVLYPLYHHKYGFSFAFRTIKILKQLNESQWLPYDKIAALQNNKLQRLIKHVYYNVPYYQDIMNKNSIKPNDIQTVEDLKHFPVLTKIEIKNNFNKIVSRDIKSRNAFKASTSGTTGSPLIYYRDLNTLAWTEAARLRGWSWARYNIGDSIVKFSSHQWPSKLGKLRIGLINEHEFPAFAKKDELRLFFSQIKELNPFCLTGLSSVLYHLASVYDTYDKHDLHIPVIFSTSEMLYDYQRALLEKLFSSRVYDFYGCNEIGSMAYECENKSKHISHEHVIVEITDSTGNSIINKTGEITLTDLDNYAMPFIRYKLGDVGSISNQKCSCGRDLSILNSVGGRTQDFLSTTDGNLVPSIFFPSRFRSLKGIEQYQIIQSSLDHITLKFVKNEDYTVKELEEMISAIKEGVGIGINIEVEECVMIPLTGRGKTRLVISHVPIQFNS